MEEMVVQPLLVSVSTLTLATETENDDVVETQLSGFHWQTAIITATNTVARVEDDHLDIPCCLEDCFLCEFLDLGF